MLNYDLNDNFKVIQTQQGYDTDFHTGQLQIENVKLNYIYDCGLTKDEFLKFYKNNPQKIDILFISHFHEDHINDILDLTDLGIFKNTRVILPYKNDRDKLLYGAIGCLKNEEFLNRYIEFLKNDNVIWIQRYNNNYYYDFNYLNYINNSISIKLNDNNQFETEECNNIITIKYKNIGLNWCFITYTNHSEKLDEIWNNIIKQNNNLKILNENYNLSKDFDSAKKYILEIRDVIKKIKVKNILGDSSFANLISLCLYSGPLLCPHDITWFDDRTFRNLNEFFGQQYYFNLHQFYLPFYCPFYFPTDSVGWIHTGDSNLKDEKLYTYFIHFYKHVLNKTGVISLPHHGSKNNINKKLFEDCNPYHFIIPEFYKAKKSTWLVNQQAKNPNKIISVSKGNSFSLETLSDNKFFIGKVEQKQNFNNLNGILKFEYFDKENDRHKLCEYNNNYITRSPKRPRQLTKDKLLFLTVLKPSKNESPIIIGRARTHGVDETNIINNEKEYPYYVSLYNIELIDTQIENCIPLYDIIEHFEKINRNPFEDSKAKNFYRAYAQQSYRLIIDDAKDYINKNLEEKFASYGKKIIN
ncbi:MBL fold metallo-hydrolase [bacterium]|nr:MBL fold metallo-hydrolase [bacterium]